MAKVFVTWQDVDVFVEHFKTQHQGVQFTGVYGIPRGGLVLAVMLSHKLHIPMLASPVEGCLIVDDICDSGESLLHYVNNTSGGQQNDYYIVTMYYKPNTLNVTPDFYGATKYEDWIVFPWEDKEE